MYIDFGLYIVEILAAGAIFLGCLTRTLLPFFKKKAVAVKAGEEIRWQGRYTWTVLFAVVVAIVATMLILPSFEIPAASLVPLAFLEGWAAQDIINKVAT